jgi:hypothetical protein
LSHHQTHFLVAVVAAVAAAAPVVAAVWLFPLEFALPLPPKQKEASLGSVDRAYLYNLANKSN